MDLAKAEASARQLMEKYRLFDWYFRFNKSTTCFGRCIHKIRYIELSSLYVMLNTEKLVEETIRHEIAHALLPYKCERNHHGPKWQAAARSLGIEPMAECHPDTVYPYKFWAKCQSCGESFHRNRRGRQACGRCVKRLMSVRPLISRDDAIELLQLKWRRTGIGEFARNG